MDTIEKEAPYPDEDRKSLEALAAGHEERMLQLNADFSARHSLEWQQLQEEAVSDLRDAMMRLSAEQYSREAFVIELYLNCTPGREQEATRVSIFKE